jgi:hypothetical protein
VGIEMEQSTHYPALKKCVAEKRFR